MPQPSSQPPPPPPVEGCVIDSVPMPTELNVEPPLMANVTLALLPVLVMVRVPVEGVVEPWVVICTCSTSVPPVVLPLTGV